MKSKSQKLMLLVLAMISGMGTGIIHAQRSNFYGTSKHGGEFNHGTIFMTNENGLDLKVLYSFPVQNPGTPVDFCEAENGKIYGVAAQGPLNGGLLFEWDPATGFCTKKVDFKGIENGKHPRSLMRADNGKLYGMTMEGGVNNCGVLFEWDPSTETLIKKLDFNGTDNGGHPNPLIQADNGMLYGTTYSGGANDCGVFFEWDPTTDTYTKKLDFSKIENGGHPNKPLIQATNGKIYSMTGWGGANNIGVLFEWDPDSDTFTKIMDFQGGGPSSGSFMQEVDGKLYGIAYGGTYNKGTLIEFDLVSGDYSIKYNFNGVETGAHPEVLLISDDGKFYGITNEGGVNDDGVLFEWDPVTNIFSKKIDFKERENGRSPLKLIRTSTGKYFGLTGDGGVYEHGLLFEWDPAAEILINRLDFNIAESGSYPRGPLVPLSNGSLYGLTYNGGVHGHGVIFEWSPASKVYTKKFDFPGAEYGGSPLGSMVEAENGKLYGMTVDGGEYGFGVLFEWDPVAGIYTNKLDFNGAEKGKNPYGTLTIGDNNRLYGLVGFGGLEDYGVLFEWDPEADTFTKKLDFNGAEFGSNPFGSLIKAGNGKLYGMTSKGGVYDRGVIFEYDPITGIYVKKFDFNGENGAYPWGSLALGDNEKLYGMTSMGGDWGVLFEWDLATDTYRKIVDFDEDTTGCEPYGTPLIAENGKIYGTTSIGGANNYGTLFEWNPETEVFRVLYDLSEIEILSGSLKKSEPNLSVNITEVNPLIELFNKSFSQISISECHGYTSPSGKYTWNTSGIYTDTIPNSTGGDSIITVDLTVHSNTSNTITPTSCKSYTSPGGKIWETSGLYMDTIPNAAGCDSIFTVYLTVITTDTSVTKDRSTLTANASGASYQWVDCDQGFQPVTGEINQTFTATKNGNYALILSQYGCADTSSCIEVNVTGSPVWNSFEQEVILYPNPVEGSFTVDLGKAYPEIEVRISESSGRIIQSEAARDSRTVQLDLKGSPGIYMIMVTAGNEGAIFKILKN